MTVETLGVPLKISSEWNLSTQGMEEQPVQSSKNDFLLRATQEVEPDFSVRSDLS